MNMTARGAADFLTRSTAVLATIFIILAITLAAYAGTKRQPATIDTSLANQVAPVQQQQPVPGQPQQQPPANQPAPAVPIQ